MGEGGLASPFGCGAGGASMNATLWNLLVIVACYLVPALVLRFLGGFNSAADAVARWGRSSSLRRVRRAGQTPSSYARARIRS
jgi:hypothetical protein